MTPFGGENAEGYYDEGLTAGVKGDLAAAVASFEKAVALDAGFLAAYLQLAKCCVRLGQSAKAVRLLYHVVSRSPGMLVARLDLGFALIEQGALREAQEQFATALEQQPGNARARLGLASVCFAEGNWPGAMAFCQEARAKGGEGFPVLYLLGRAAGLAGNHAAAAKAFEEADALIKDSMGGKGEHAEGHYLRGELAFHQNRDSAALEHYQAAEKLAESGKHYSVFGQSFAWTDILAKQGLCLQRMGETELARKMGARILDAEPNHKLGQALKGL